MKKIIKIFVVLLSIAVIIFSVVNIVKPNSSATDNDEGFTEVATWSSEETNNKCKLSFTVFSDASVNVDVELNQVGSNGFYPLDELYNCQYDSDIIFWDFCIGTENDSWASIVPYDCTSAQIDGVIYESKNAEITINNETHSFRYIITDVSHMDEHEIVLLDEKGKSHTEKTIKNPFD